MEDVIAVDSSTMFCRMQCAKVKCLAATIHHNANMACQPASKSIQTLHSILAYYFNKQQRQITVATQEHDYARALHETRT